MAEGFTTAEVVGILSRLGEERQRKEASQELWYTLVLSELQRLSWEDDELRANVVSIARPHLKQSSKKREEWRLGIVLGAWRVLAFMGKALGPIPSMEQTGLGNSQLEPQHSGDTGGRVRN